MVFAFSPRQITYDETYPAHLPGLAKTKLLAIEDDAKNI
jgi:hypothetical protein